MLRGTFNNGEPKERLGVYFSVTGQRVCRSKSMMQTGLKPPEARKSLADSNLVLFPARAGHFAIRAPRNFPNLLRLHRRR